MTVSTLQAVGVNKVILSGCKLFVCRSECPILGLTYFELFSDDSVIYRTQQIMDARLSEIFIVMLCIFRSIFHVILYSGKKN
jgi:hypothetical protein